MNFIRQFCLTIYWHIKRSWNLNLKNWIWNKKSVKNKTENKKKTKKKIKEPKKSKEEEVKDRNLN